MKLNGKILVTGGAGFIGSHLLDSLIRCGIEVVVLDNLSSSRLENVADWLGDDRLTFVRGDLLKPDDIEGAMEGCGAVFHLAANTEVRLGAINTRVHYEQNILATYNLLEAMRKSDLCKNIVFTSSSTVYGEAEIVPTHEDYGPLKPISLYGASKLACESLISGYVHMFDIKSIIFRLANIVGAKNNHGVIYDFVRKLKENPRALTVLGNGAQRKSYLYADDCVKAILTAVEKWQDRIEIYNVGSEDSADVLTIARVVVEEMGIKGTAISCTGGLEGGRGWKGDVKDMLLDISKMKKLGWKPKYNSVEAVRLVAKEILVKPIIGDVLEELVRTGM